MLGVAFLFAAIIIAGIMALTQTTADKKADLKNAVIGFAVGAFLIIAPTTVIKIILELKMQE
jgi:hypothetical protein